MNALENAVNGIVTASANAIKPNEGDYIVDGLLYCVKCNTPKQCRVELFGKTRTPMCLCKCEAARRDQEEAERERLEVEKRINSLRKTGFPDDEMSKWTFSADDKSNEYISNIAQNYVDNFSEMYERGKGLLFYGKVGTGKTFISACIANALIDKGRPCLVTNFARITNTVSGLFDGKQQYYDSLNNFALLVIDDLSSERDTEYVGEIIQNVIDSRYRSKLPLIITTNLTSEELKHPADMRKQRIYSRLLEMCIPIEVKGKDRRKMKLKSDFGEFANLLGIKS